jgi:type VI secretion system secreted protein Hcp
MPADQYLKIQGVDGESTAHGFEKWIDVLSFSWGAEAPTQVGPGGGGGMSTGRVQVSAFNLSKRADTSTPILFQYCCAGKHFPSATVVLTKAGGGGQDLKFLTYDFKQVFVTSIQMAGGNTGDSVPMDAVAFSFGAVEISYTPQTVTGGAGSPVRASYDLTTAKV